MIVPVKSGDLSFVLFAGNSLPSDFCLFEFVWFIGQYFPYVRKAPPLIYVIQLFDSSDQKLLIRQGYDEWLDCPYREVSFQKWRHLVEKLNSLPAMVMTILDPMKDTVDRALERKDLSEELREELVGVSEGLRLIIVHAKQALKALDPAYPWES